MPWSALITIMNQTWQHDLDADQEPARCVRGMVVEIVDFTGQQLPDDLNGYFSPRELNAFWYIQVDDIDDTITLDDYKEWLLPRHVSETQGRLNYSFTNGAPQIGDIITGQTNGVTGTIAELNDQSDEALRFTGDPKAFEIGEWIFQQSNRDINARIQSYLQEPDGRHWFRLNRASGVFEVGQSFEGLNTQAIGLTDEVGIYHGGRMGLTNVTGNPGDEAITQRFTASPSGVEGWVTGGGYRNLARTKRLVPFSWGNSPIHQQVRADFTTKGWTQGTHNQFRNLVRRHPDETTPSKDADVMDAATLDDDFLQGRRRR